MCWETRCALADLPLAINFCLQIISSGIINRPQSALVLSFVLSKIMMTVVRVPASRILLPPAAYICMNNLKRKWAPSHLEHP